MLANISIEIILKIFFLFFNNINIKYVEVKKLIWKFYNTIKTLFITSQIELIDKKKLSKVALYDNSKTCVIHVVVLEILTFMPNYYFKGS